jgi:hypothetical protein
VSHQAINRTFQKLSADQLIEPAGNDAEAFPSGLKQSLDYG